MNHKPFKFTINMANILFCVIIIMIVAYIWHATSTYPAALAAVGYGPGFLPRIVAFVMLLLSLFFLVQNIKILFINKEAEEILSFDNFKLLIAFLAVLLLYVLAFRSFGHLASTFIFLMIAMYMLKIKIWLAFLASSTFTIMVYILFTVILRVRM